MSILSVNADMNRELSRERAEVCGRLFEGYGLSSLHGRKHDFDVAGALQGADCAG